MFVLAFLAIGTIALIIPYLIIHLGMDLSYDIGAVRFVGIIPIILSLYMGFRSIRDFAIYGKGTRTPTKPPEALVAKGIYQVTRNPMYLAVFCFILGEAIIFQSVALIVYFILVWLIFHLFWSFTLKSLLSVKSSVNHMKIIQWRSALAAGN